MVEELQEAERHHFVGRLLGSQHTQLATVQIRCGLLPGRCRIYISTAIDQLEQELDEKISAVADHLSTAMRVVTRFQRWSPKQSVHQGDLGKRPEPMTMPTFPHRPYLNVWQKLTWLFLSSQARQRALDTNTRFQDAWQQYWTKWQTAIAARDAEIASFDAAARARSQEIAEFNASIDELERKARSGDLEAQWILFESRLERLFRDLDPLTGEHTVTYSADSHRLVVEFSVPTRSVVPVEKSVRFLKTTGEHRYSYRAEADIKRMYTAFVAQAVLGVVNGAFALSSEQLVGTVGVNAVVEAPDPATGVMSQVPIVSVVVARSVFSEIQLAEVDPIACLKHLSAVVSRSPAEVVPIRPIVRLDMSDPRFIGNVDVLDQLDARPNLMELTPGEFEALVQNLFSKMGLDTKQTRPSRDGGVDAIAYDPRPILGGKIVIQAKRYKGTVGVSAVRDLFGTLQNEGGSKGILVTTSGYGQASFEFAKNKPLELIDGSNLLFLLKEHASIDAKIVMPEDWVDPLPGAEY